VLMLPLKSFLSCSNSSLLKGCDYVSSGAVQLKRYLSSNGGVPDHSRGGGKSSMPILDEGKKCAKLLITE
jgi:hypothetical protein